MNGKENHENSMPKAPFYGDREVTVPKVTVLMSVFNGEKYLSGAINSMLSQTFEDFEFIIIDDGSTDGSLKIAQACEDKRVSVVCNNENLGLAKSLNKGIDLAMGEYIARMDCDDVSLPQRLEKQVAFLDNDLFCCAVAAKTSWIDANDREDSGWAADRETTSPEEIRRRLPVQNCIAHPSVMIRSDTIRTYRYNERLKMAQDYELWLRMCSDGKKIGKLDERLIILRRHEDSITVTSGWYGRALFMARLKARLFLWKLVQLKVRKWDIFVLICAIKDLAEVVWRFFRESLWYLMTSTKKFLRR